MSGASTPINVNVLGNQSNGAFGDGFPFGQQYQNISPFLASQQEQIPASNSILNNQYTMPVLIFLGIVVIGKLIKR